VESESTAPPGWHPDPVDPTALRWWDGTQWTDYRSPGPGYAPPSESPHGQHPQDQYPHGQHPQDQYPQGQHPSSPSPQTLYPAPPDDSASNGQPGQPHPDPQSPAQYPYGQSGGYGRPRGHRGMGGGFGGPGIGLGMGRGGRRGVPRGANSFSWTAIGFAVVYVALAVTTGFVLLGIVPIMSSVRAVQRKEKLAPLAVAAAIVAVGSAIYILAHGHR
jgi:hypothetical protein